MRVSLPTDLPNSLKYAIRCGRICTAKSLNSALQVFQTSIPVSVQLAYSIFSYFPPHTQKTGQLAQSKYEFEDTRELKSCTKILVPSLIFSTFQLFYRSLCKFCSESRPEKHEKSTLQGLAERSFLVFAYSPDIDKVNIFEKVSREDIK